MAKVPYSIRIGINPRAAGLDFKTIKSLFVRLFDQLAEEGYTHEYFGFACVDEDHIKGKILDVDYDILIALRKELLWPPSGWVNLYKEDDLFDVIEYLFDRVSKPLTGNMHTYNQCGMHWETFDKVAGQSEYRKRINELLSHYEHPFELSSDGLILQRAPTGFEHLYNADVPTEDKTIGERVHAAITEYRRHGATVDSRRHAVSDLAGVLEALRPKMGDAITSKDEADLFNIANNFAIRHHNDKQKTDYEASVWLSWMFYVYLSTIHLILRRLEIKKPKRNPGDLVFKDRADR